MDERRKDAHGVPLMGRRAGDIHHEIKEIRTALDRHIQAFKIHDEVETKDREDIIKQMNANTTQINVL